MIKPPVIAWAELKIHDMHPSIDFLNEIYAPLVRWNEWWFMENDDDADGLAQYNHPYSSGLDDSSVWEHAAPMFGWTAAVLIDLGLQVGENLENL